MHFYKAILQYDGSDRKGFQLQEGTPTIQGDLNSSLQKILKGEFTTREASRTDKGVHALAQVIKISAHEPVTIEAFNAALPSHMRALELTNCESSFIPSIDQSSKEYRYLFSTEDFDYRFIAQAPKNLNIPHMQECVKMLQGTHDFKNFWSIGGISNTTIREVLDCDLSVMNPEEFFSGTIFSAENLTTAWQFRIHGRGFLKHMVRHLMGALFQVGIGEITVKDFENYLTGPLKEQRPWKKADPRGLFLVKVFYQDEQ